MITISEKSIFNVAIRDVFDAERNISLHVETQKHRGEVAVAGVTSGLIEKGEEVEWLATHFGIKQRLRVRIAEMEKPVFFRVEMVSGAFKSFRHDHRFRDMGKNRTEKSDQMWIEAPMGFLGRIAELVFLGPYMRRFLKNKNAGLKILLEKKRP